METAPLMNRNQSADVPLNVFTELWGFLFFIPLTGGYYGVVMGDENTRIQLSSPWGKKQKNPPPDKVSEHPNAN